MKKCPYCAEEIQDAAIVCPYCGRDLKPPTETVEPSEELQPPKPAEVVEENETDAPVQPSAWEAGKKGAAVFTILSAVGIMLTSYGPADLIGNLLLGIPLSYLFFWVICALLVWLWRKVGSGSFIFLFFAGIFLIGFVILIASAANTPPPPPPTATREPAPTFTPIPTATKTPMPTRTPIHSCFWWYELRENLVGKTLCVQGNIRSITGNSETSAITRIYFRSNLPEGYTWTDGRPTVFYFLDETHFYKDIGANDCVVATGEISINEDGVLFMRITGNLERCN